MAVNDPRRPDLPPEEYRPLRPRPAADVVPVGPDEVTLRRISGLINLGAMVVSGLIGLRFLLKLLAANPANPFAALIYFLSAPFVAIFVGLTPTPSFEGIQIEFYDLIAILVYFLLAWAVVRLLWILFARFRSSWCSMHKYPAVRRGTCLTSVARSHENSSPPRLRPLI